MKNKFSNNGIGMHNQGFYNSFNDSTCFYSCEHYFPAIVKNLSNHIDMLKREEKLTESSALNANAAPCIVSNEVALM